MPSRTASEHIDEDLSIFDIFDFVLDNRLVLAATTILGMLFAGIYLFVATPVYEATLQVEMAKVGRAEATAANRDGRGVPVEDAQLLVERLRLPSTYTETLFPTCNVHELPFPSKALAERVQAKIIKGVDSVVEVTVPGQSEADAKRCALGMFEMIQHQQNALLQPYVEQAQEKKSGLEARLKTNQEFLEKMNQTSVQSAVYLAKRDESMWLMNQIADIERALRQTFSTKLVSPIYSTPQPVSPKTVASLALGFFTGLVLGFILAVLRKIISEWRRRPAGGENTERR